MILWPWCLMTLAGLVPLIKPFLADKKSDWPEGIAVFGFFGGAAFLTAFSFRDALRRLATACLSGEVTDRSRIWSEKMILLAVATVCAGLIAFLAQTILGTIVWQEIHANAIEPVLLLFIIVCSTGFWTLLTRSIFAGILLTGAAQFFLYLLLVMFATAIDRMSPASPGAPRFSHDPEVHSALSWFVAGVALSYAALMLWLGRQRFVRLGLQMKPHGTEHVAST